MNDTRHHRYIYAYINDQHEELKRVVINQQTRCHMLFQMLNKKFDKCLIRVLKEVYKWYVIK